MQSRPWLGVLDVIAPSRWWRFTQIALLFVRCLGWSTMRARVFFGTYMAGSPEAHEQDDWLLDFFVSDPRWQLVSGDRLTLRKDGILIVFEERSWDPPS
jgi:hypothetical protein